MKVKEKITPEEFKIVDEIMEIKSVKYKYFCPKCEYDFTYQNFNLYKANYCYNCGVKLEFDGYKNGFLLEPLRIKTDKILQKRDGFIEMQEINPDLIVGKYVKI
jgi:transcription initiation factor IIE alpha subunit